MVVLVHGLNGTHYDMRGFKNNLAIMYPHMDFILSSSNEDLTEGDIGLMGKNLQEVKYL